MSDSLAADFKVYSDCRSGRQKPLESFFLLLLLRLRGLNACVQRQGAERLVHHIHRRLASPSLGRGSPAQRRVRPLGVVKTDSVSDQAPGGRAPPSTDDPPAHRPDPRDKNPAPRSTPRSSPSAPPKTSGACCSSASLHQLDEYTLSTCPIFRGRLTSEWTGRAGRTPSAQAFGGGPGQHRGIEASPSAGRAVNSCGHGQRLPRSTGCARRPRRVRL